MDAPAGEWRFWRAGAGKRVGAGSAAAFAGGVLVAVAHSAPAAAVGRSGLACGALAAPFFAMREVVVAGAGVDGPAASLIAGGFAGYFGTLVLVGPRMVSQGAIAVGLGCGVADVLVSAVDRRRRALQPTQPPAAVARPRTLREIAMPSSTVLADIPGDAPVKNGTIPWLKLPAWLNNFRHIDVDEEYQELIRRREATLALLEKEQQRIAALLEELEHVKAGANRLHSDAELGESHQARSART